MSEYNVFDDMKQAGLEEHVREMYENLQESWKHVGQQDIQRFASLQQ